jgi:hypothetical protein
VTVQLVRFLPKPDNARTAPLGLLETLMNLRSVALTALLLSCLHAAGAADKGLMVAMDLERDGQRLAKPSIWQLSGSTGEIALKDELRLKVTPSLKDETADLKFEIFTTQDGAELRVGAPRIITKVGEPASLAWQTSDGKHYTLKVLVSERDKPAL